MLLIVINYVLERCKPWPHVANRHISSRHCQRLSQLFSLWCNSHYDVIGATPSVTDVRTYGHLAAFNIYR